MGGGACIAEIGGALKTNSDNLVGPVRKYLEKERHSLTLMDVQALTSEQVKVGSLFSQRP